MKADTETRSVRQTDLMDETRPEECCSPAETLPAGRVADDSVADTERLALFCKALGHPTRVQIVRLLMNVETCVCGHIVEKLPLAQSTVSQHLKILKDAGLVKGEIDGPRTCYALDHDALAEFRGLSDVLM